MSVHEYHEKTKKKRKPGDKLMRAMMKEHMPKKTPMPMMKRGM